MIEEPGLDIFIAECRELLAAMEDGLLTLETAPSDGEAINAVFRAAHTIKGSAGLFALDEIVAFTHVLESVLYQVRAGETLIDSPLIALLLACGDHVSGQVNQLAGETIASDEMQVSGARLVAALGAYLQVKKEAPAALAVCASDDAGSAEPIANTATMVGADTWHISLRLNEDVLRYGMDPMSILNYLSGMGEIIAVNTLPDALPSWDELDPEAFYLGLEIDFRSSAEREEISSAFDFVRENSRIHLIPPRSALSNYVDLIRALGGEEKRLGEILLASGALSVAELEEVLRLQEENSVPPAVSVAPLGELLVEQCVVQQEIIDAALDKQKQARESKNKENRFIRVQADKLDALIGLVGELVIAGAGAQLLAASAGKGKLHESVGQVGRLVEEIRDSALKLRMVEIGETFQRFQRVVRDVSHELGKEIDLQISGGETELDKTLVEKISDPLTHLVRNAIDHGIEPAARRLAAGKAEKGTVKLHAYHDSGSIVIEVSDDGSGLSRDKILAKGLALGLVQPGSNLSDQEIYHLIFEPGFSTASAVTNLSGRGVGMDVVRRNIESLRGTVELMTSEGLGTSFHIRLPLTLAIIDGFVVGVGQSSYVIPLDMVTECVEFDAAEDSSERQRHYMNLRGQVLPLLRLRAHFNASQDVADGQRESIVVVRHGRHQAGLVVDALQGEFQTVIKPLGALFRKLRGISGSTILGNGEVALIIDVPALLAHAEMPISPALAVPVAATV